MIDPTLVELQKLMFQWRVKASAAKGVAAMAGREEDQSDLEVEAETLTNCADALRSVIAALQQSKGTKS